MASSDLRLSSPAYTFRTLHRTPGLFTICVVLITAARADAQTTVPPSVTLTPASAITLPGGVDSNSPAVWDMVDGVETLQVVTSVAGQPSLSSGRRLARLGQAEPVEFITHPGDGVWMESVIADEGGTWYGYYHSEVPAAFCERPGRTLPRIGAARSRDRGETWEDLGIILEAPPGWHDCATPNQYFVGGVGDASVVLDRESKDLYFYFSQYSRYAPAQGVALARLAWADRDSPVGRITVLNDGAWLHATRVTTTDDDGNTRTGWTYPSGTPLVAVTQPWHDEDPSDDAFWGASVHWNVSLQLYVMLLNRTKDEQFTQEGIYVSFAARLDEPAAWTTPMKILGGRSTQFIEFGR